MDNMYASLRELAEQRRSCRHFLSEPVSAEDVERILAVASRSPFASGRSSWKIAVIREPETIAALASQVRLHAEALAGRMDEETAPFFRRYARNFTLFESAPMLLVPYCRETSTMKSILREGATEDILAWEHDNLTKSLSCVAMMILLAAESLGLGACYMTGPLMMGKSLNGVLGLCDHFLPGAIIPVGQKAEG
ncbi:MAG: nitroreductase family protein [Bacteroidales bacterium]|nr:nitroreductase family protein [Bacteroidales bacterium]